VAEVEGLHDLLGSFAEAGANRLLLTKTDETARPGRLVKFLTTSSLPISYVTNGQNVPADIRPAAAEQLAEWLLSERDAKEL
jgi:flagellar biosynthesis protein FlhF